MTDLVDRVRERRQRLEVLSGESTDKSFKRGCAKDISLLVACEDELVRLQAQENWARHLEGECSALKERLGVLA